MKVEDVTGRAGVTSHAVRYYARFGLLEPERHPGNGYRVYPLCGRCIGCVSFIVNALRLRCIRSRGGEHIVVRGESGRW